MNTPHSYYYPLFEHMAQTHNLTLLDSECEDICRAVEQVTHATERAERAEAACADMQREIERLTPMAVSAAIHVQPRETLITSGGTWPENESTETDYVPRAELEKKVCINGECGGECYRCRLAEAHKEIEQLKADRRMLFDKCNVAGAFGPLADGWDSRWAHLWEDGELDTVPAITRPQGNEAIAHAKEILPPPAPAASVSTESSVSRGTTPTTGGGAL